MSGDGFAIVNLAAKSLFPAFRPKNTFAMFNDNTIDFSFVAPSATGTAPAHGHFARTHRPRRRGAAGP